VNMGLYFGLFRCCRLSPFVLCRLVDLCDICFVIFVRRLIVDGLLLRVDKPACRPLLFWTWSLVIDDVPPLLYLYLQISSFIRLRLKFLR